MLSWNETLMEDQRKKVQSYKFSRSKLTNAETTYYISIHNIWLVLSLKT